MGAMLMILLFVSAADNASPREGPREWRQAEREWREAFNEGSKDFKSQPPDTPVKKQRKLPPQPKGADDPRIKKSPPLDWQPDPGDDKQWRAGGHYAIRATPGGFQLYQVVKGKLVQMGEPWDSQLDAAEMAQRDATRRDIAEARKAIKAAKATAARKKQSTQRYAKAAKPTARSGNRQNPPRQRSPQATKRNQLADSPKPRKPSRSRQLMGSGGIF